MAFMEGLLLPRTTLGTFHVLPFLYNQLTRLVLSVPTLQMRKLRRGGVKELAQVMETCPHPLHHFEGVLGKVR